jgi:hypothetical protein
MKGAYYYSLLKEYPNCKKLKEDIYILECILASYNAGPASVANAIEKARQQGISEADSVYFQNYKEYLHRSSEVQVHVETVISYWLSLKES